MKAVNTMQRRNQEIDICNIKHTMLEKMLLVLDLHSQCSVENSFLQEYHIGHDELKCTNENLSRDIAYFFLFEAVLKIRGRRPRHKLLSCLLQ